MRKKLVLVGSAVNGNLILPPSQLELRRLWLNSTQTFSLIETLDVPKKPKSQQQLGAIFGLIIETVKRSLDDRGWDICGSPWTREQIRACLYHQYHVKFNTAKTLSKMEMAEVSEFIDSCYQWCAGSPWFIPIPLADPNWRENISQK